MPFRTVPPVAAGGRPEGKVPDCSAAVNKKNDSTVAGGFTLPHVKGFVGRRHTLSNVLSGRPSQSLSCGDEQSRAPGPTEPMQPLNALVALLVPARQLCEPALHGPLPSRPG